MLHIAHRGASAHEPENTLRAIRAALTLGADAIEIDVHLVEGHLVVIHDLDVDRTTNGHGTVRSFSFERLRQLDAGKGERIPTLQEVTELVAGAVPLIVELKGAGTGAPVARYVQEQVGAGRSTVSGLYGVLVRSGTNCKPPWRQSRICRAPCCFKVCRSASPPLPRRCVLSHSI